MTGKSIPRRYSKIQQDTKTASRIEESAVYFRFLQEFSAAKPFMDPTISVKVLAEGPVLVMARNALLGPTATIMMVP
jgi:hypothetical protein